jgi:WD40 repeat protein
MMRIVLVVCALTPFVAVAEPPNVDQFGDPLPQGAVARLGSSRWRPGGGAQIVRFQPGGSLLTVSDNLVVQEWEANTGRELHHIDLQAALLKVTPSLISLRSQFAAGRPMALSGDGKKLAVASGDEKIHLLDVTTGKYLRTIGPTMTSGPLLVMSHDGSLLAETCELLEPAPRQPIKKATVWITTTNAAPKVLSVSGTILFAAHAGFSLDGRSFWQSALALDPATQVGQPTLVRWDLERGGDPVLNMLNDQPERAAAAPAVSHDQKAAAMRVGGSIRIVKLDDSKELVRIPPTNATRQITHLLFSHDNRSLIGTAGPGSPLTIWDAVSGKELRQFAEFPLLWSRAYVPNPAYDIAPDGKALAWSERLIPVLLDLEIGKARNEPNGHSGPLREAFFTPDGRDVVTRSTDGLIIRWDPETGRKIRQYDLPGRPESCMITPDLRWILVATFGQGGTQFTVRDAASGEEKGRITPATGPQSSWVLVPDSKHVCFTSRQTNKIVVSDIATGQKHFEATLPDARSGSPQSNGGELARSQVSSAAMPLNREAFSRDGRLLGVVSTGSVTVWDLAVGRQVGRISRAGLGVVRGLYLPSDGLTIVLDTEAGLTIWELATGTKRLTLLEGQKPTNDVSTVTTIRFPRASYFPQAVTTSPDGRLLARAGDDRSIHVWDVWTGKEVGLFTGHRGMVVTLNFSPDGRRLVSGCADSTALVWDVAPLAEKSPRSSASVDDSADALWDALIDTDGTKAFAAMRKLAGEAAAAVALIGKRVKRSEPADAAVIDKWIADLNDSKFAVREKARGELERLAERAAPALRRTVASPPSAEVRQSARRLLDALGPVKLTPDQVRAVRAVEVLERIGAPEAADVLKELAGGADEVAPTPQARAALSRIHKQDPSPAAGRK